MKLELRKSILEIEATAWDRVTDPDFPFYSYHFLRALETTDCLGSRTGWYPVYITVEDGKDLLAATVAFEKTNSWGEYVFDFAWADAHHSLGLKYYPKLVLAVPFTPATGAKLLLANGLGPAARAEALGLLFGALARLGQAAELSSVHALFIAEREHQDFANAGYFLRSGYQFHWRNEGYRDFADFTGRLRSKRRHELKREREQVVNKGITIERLTGDSLNPELAKLFYGFYLSTIDKKASFDYLSRDFFAEVFRALGDKLLLVLARERDGRPVAAALNYVGTETLYGRNWGCFEEYRSLHFEVCYHQGIEFAIEKGLKRFEAGAQGEHKLNRGFLPVKTYSAHRLLNPRLDQPVRDFCAAEARGVDEVVENMRARSPFTRVDVSS